MGFEVTWLVDRYTAVLAKGDLTILIPTWETQFIVNGNLTTPEVSQQLINGRFMLPLRAVAEATGASVEWDPITSTVIITTQITITQLPQFIFSKDTGLIETESKSLEDTYSYEGEFEAYNAKYYKKLLTEEEKRIYNAIIYMTENSAPFVTFSTELSNKRIEEIMFMAIFDYPSLEENIHYSLGHGLLVHPSESINGQSYIKGKLSATSEEEFLIRKDSKYRTIMINSFFPNKLAQNKKTLLKQKRSSLLCRPSKLNMKKEPIYINTLLKT